MRSAHNILFFGYTLRNEPVITSKYTYLDIHQAFLFSADGKIKAITDKHTPENPELEFKYSS